MRQAPSLPSLTVAAAHGIGVHTSHYTPEAQTVGTLLGTYAGLFPRFASTTLQTSATVGRAMAFSVPVPVAGAPKLGWRLSSPIPGLTLIAATGGISGTPKRPGVFTKKITVTPPRRLPAVTLTLTVVVSP